LAGALLFDEKNFQMDALFWFGLRVSSNILLTSRNPKDNSYFPHFWRPVWRKKIPVCGHTTRDPNK
jgi:hypothetical protein